MFFSIPKRSKFYSEYVNMMTLNKSIYFSISSIISLFLEKSSLGENPYSLNGANVQLSYFMKRELSAFEIPVESFTETPKVKTIMKNEAICEFQMSASCFVYRNHLNELQSQSELKKQDTTKFPCVDAFVLCGAVYCVIQSQLFKLANG